MKTITKLMLMSAIALILGLSAQAGVFTVDNSNTTLQKVDGQSIDTNWTIVSSATLDFVSKVSYYQNAGENMNRAAFVWSVPAGQQIVKITFGDIYNGDPSRFQAVIYNLSAGGTLTATTPILWPSPSPFGFTAETREINYSASEGVTRIGFGFTTVNAGQISSPWYEQYNNIVVTTVPEPSALALLAVGGLLTLNRKRKTR